jgi:glycosyltransferase involved in cell wall biosynthesis
MNILAYVHLRNIVNSTGAGRVARQMTEHLGRIDDVNLRVLADAGDHRRFVAAAGAPWTGYDYRLFANDTSRQQALWFLLREPRAESYWNEAEIIYCTGESYVPSRKAKLVVTMHDAAHFESHAHPRTTAQWKQKMKWRLLFTTLAKKADLFHTVSQFSADRLGYYFPEMRRRFAVVHNAVSERFFNAPAAEGQSYLESEGLAGRRFVLVPGGLHFRKNAELILAGWPLLAERDPDLLLVVVNHCDPAYVERAQALGSRVRLQGYVSDESLCSLYSAATVVWFPSRYEGFGMPVLEAMACGAPVVASDSSAIPEVAGNAALLAPPADAAKHIEAIQGLLCDERERCARIEAGRKRAAAFRWHESARQLHTCFQSLI